MAAEAQCVDLADRVSKSLMGCRGDGQGQLFYSFDLDEVVPPDHVVRQIDAILDLSWVHKELAPYYSHSRPLTPIPGAIPNSRSVPACCSSSL